jgi:hypothetical protein
MTVAGGVRLAHIDVDVRVVLRWGLADTHEFLYDRIDPLAKLAARR